MALGESLNRVGKPTGHGQVATTARYTHLARDSMHETAARAADDIAADIPLERSCADAFRCTLLIRHRLRLR